ncbi:MAG TPA: alpha/beta hydrolase, partial [Turneriella sp.]|nr:alpha/beta hydrolase [Turneriella sp.]
MATINEQDIRAKIAKRIVSAGARFAFNERTPLPTLRWIIDQIRFIERLAPDVELTEGVVDLIEYDFFTPATFQPGRILLYSHGGAYTMFSHRTHRSLVSRLALEFNAQAIAHNYRLAPEHPFPAAVDDTIRIYQYLLSLGYAPANIIAAGDSAGGGLTFAFMLAARDKGLPLPRFAIGISPWVDLTAVGDSMQENKATDVMLSPEGIKKFGLRYVQDVNKLKHPYASPLFADLRGLPSVFLQAAGDEILRD